MTSVQTLFSEPPAPTVVSCDWCGVPAFVCAAAERDDGGRPSRIGLCEEHHVQLVAATASGEGTEERTAYERRRAEREADLRRQRSAWQVRKAARQSSTRDRGLGRQQPRGRVVPALAYPGTDSRGAGESTACPQDSEELVASILQGERPVSPVEVVDPRLEDPARTVERLREALWPLVELAEECGIFVDCNPSQTHSVLVVGEVPVQALFRARDLLKRER